MLENLSGLTGSPIRRGGLASVMPSGSAKEGTTHVQRLIGPLHDQIGEFKGVQKSLKGLELADNPNVSRGKRPSAPKLLRARMASVWELAARRAQQTSQLVAKSRAQCRSGISSASGLRISLATTRQLVPSDASQLNSPMRKYQQG